MWFYLGFFTTIVALTVRLHQKMQIKSALQLRKKNLIPVSAKNYKFELSPATDKQPATGYLEIPCKTTLQFSARFETGYDKSANLIGLSYEYQTGKPAFDNAIYLASITETDAELIGKDAKIRVLILNLLSGLSSNKFKNKDFHLKNELICDGEVLHLKNVFRDESEANQSKFVDKKLPDLKAFAELLNTYEATSTHFWKVPAQRNTAIILAISSTFGILGMFEALRFFALDSILLFEPFSIVTNAAKIALAGLLLLILATLKYIKKSARRHLILFEVCVTGFFGLAFSAYGWIYDANMHFDKSKSNIVSYELTNKHTERHRTRRSSYTTYHLSLSGTQAPVKPTIKVSSAFYTQVNKGDFIAITIRNGYLSQPWMENIQKCIDCDATGDNKSW
jgi:hypothetical protein